MDFIGFDKIEKRIKSLTERLRGGLDEVARELHNVFLVLTIKCRTMSEPEEHAGKERVKKQSQN